MADSSDMVWNWTYICETGLTPWLPQENYLAPCFQEICLQLPAFIVFSIVSAFHFGRQTLLVRRDGTQNFLISMRIMAILFLTLLQFYKMYYLISSKVPIWPIDVLIVGFQIISGYVHIGFLFSLRHHGDKSHRGPLLIIVVWITLALLSIVWLFQNSSHNKIIDRIAVALHIVYGLTLTLKGSATYVRRIRDDERQSLIGTSYIRFQDDIQIEALGQAQDEAPILSKLLFCWVNPLIEKGLCGNLRRIDDLFDLPECLSLNNIIEKLQNSLAQSISLLTALHRVFGIEFYLIGLLRFAADMLSFGGPLLLAALLNSESGDNNGTDMKAYAYAFGLFATTLLDAFFGTHFNWRMSLISMKIRIGITSTIYRKTLTAQFVDGSSPEVLNLMSTDTDRICNSCASFHSFWSIPFRLFASLYLLYTQIGIAFVGGVIFGVILIPINRWLANKISSLSVELLSAKDARVSQSMEALSGIKQIKILAWEDVFIERIQNSRKSELKALSKRKYLDALCVYFWATTPIIINLLTFGTATLLGTPMTAATTFASIALLNMLIAPLNAFPWVLNGLVEAWISLKRVQSYLDLPDVDFSKYYSPLEVSIPSEEETSHRPIVISMKNVSFECNAENGRLTETDRHRRPFVLNSFSVDIKKGDLVCVEGPVGSGKSAFLNAINGNLNRVSGHISIENADEGMAYVAQQPWLQHGTMRENILWGEMFDESRYRKVLWACALQKDIDDLGGDNIDIGEGGCTLSGGQKARVALARAVYQDKQIILIDDVLASTDAHVSKHIIKHCILGILSGRTRIIVTESRTLFYYSNQILRVDGGVVSVSDYSLGSFESDIVTESASADEFSSPVNFELSNEEKPIYSIFDEIKETGALSARVLAVYWKAWGPTIGFIVFLSIVLMQATKNFSDTWLAHWIMSIKSPNSTIQSPVESPINSNISRQYPDNVKYNVICMIERSLLWPKLTDCESLHNSTFRIEESQTASNNFYLFIYIGIAIFNSAIALIRAFAFAFAGIKAAKFMHERLLNSVFSTEFTFFDITPLGRILNRFSSDTTTIDDSLPFILNILLAQVAGLIGSLCVSLYGMPWLGLFIVPMIPIYLNIQSRYRNSSRDIKRLSSNAMSPIYTHFTETVQGLPTIRSMRANIRFNKDFLVKLEESIRAQLTASAAQQWLALRLHLLGSFLVGGSGLVAVITSRHSTIPELTGLVISYSLSITAFLSGVLNTLTETEQELIAVERVYGYSRLNAEHNANGSRDPPFGWPCQGVVRFDNVSLKYRSYLKPALKNIDFQTSSCERIGIVGRTGAGKSSIMAALIRIAPLSTGYVTIDTVDVSTLPLNVLRSRIAFVPQDAFLFSGTIRENLDPRNLHLDSHIWDAINRCLASPLVQRLGGLNGIIDRKGSNISAGQKQLLCLARALLRKSKVVIIDEGTSNLDSESENAIHLILRNAFETSTVLLIAHRLNGLQETNRIFVVEDGEIVEKGYSHVLATNPTSRFYALLQEQQQNR